MNAVEIEQALSQLVAEPFDADTFAFEFLRAFGNKDTTLKKLRAGASNNSDLGGVLQRNHIHILVCPDGGVGEGMALLQNSPASTRWKVRFLLATDGKDVQLRDVRSDEFVVTTWEGLPDQFGVLLPLAGIETVREIVDNVVDVKATGRLNKLYIALLHDNPAWGTADGANAMNRFMARLIFCFFAEDTEIFGGSSTFTDTVTTMTERDGSNVHSVLQTLFRSMNTPLDQREAAGIPRWAAAFPLVNGNLLAGDIDIPRFSMITRSYLLDLGRLDWTKINPDIFGSMIQAVAEPDERAQLGMHYTSVPNILKVLNPLFLDELREATAAASDSPRTLLNIKKRLARIRVFDPACGSGNFLVIAYKELRAIEHTINVGRGEPGAPSLLELTNFRGIELRPFAAEIARLALIIAQYQCDALYRGQTEAIHGLLPLSSDNWIVCGNALQLDWREICPPLGRGAAIVHTAGDLFDTPLEQPVIGFENDGGETYICGNPPFLGSQIQKAPQKADLEGVFSKYTTTWRSLDYSAGWFMKAAEYCNGTGAMAALVTTNSLCQGRSVDTLWPHILKLDVCIQFAYTSFKWSNLAAYNAGVTVSIVALGSRQEGLRSLYTEAIDGSLERRLVKNINPYLVAGPDIIVSSRREPISELSKMSFGNMPNDGGFLLLTREERDNLFVSSQQSAVDIVRRVYGSQEFIRGEERYCLWIDDESLPFANSIPAVRERIEAVRATRLASRDSGARKLAERPHQFREMNCGVVSITVVPRHSSESRAYLPVGYFDRNSIVSDSAFALYDAPLWNLALIASRVHLIWIGAVCGKLETRYRYSNTLGWNTFPVPVLTEKNKHDLERCAEDILLAREAHFPKTIADLYEQGAMPSDLQAAHDRNDEVVERIFIGRRFRNDSERLEVLFERYATMVQKSARAKGGAS